MFKAYGLEPVPLDANSLGKSQFVSNGAENSF